MGAPTNILMRLLFLGALLALSACASDDSADITIQGVDPVQTDSDVAPDASLQPEPIQPPVGTAEGGTVEPEATLQPQSDDIP